MTGCRNNRYELNQILSWAIKNNISVVSEDKADYCIINTCTVTHVADKKSRQMVRRTKNGQKKLKTIVFGCAVRMQKEAFKEINEIDYLLDDLPSVIRFLDEINIKNQQSKNTKNIIIDDSFFRSRALVQIQDGCDNYCSYCIICKARGKSKNRAEKDIINEIKKHQEDGFNEIVLTGINIGAYGCDITTKYEDSMFINLLEKILSETDIQRVRISSLGPEYFTDKWYEILKNPRICRYIHLSIQSGSTSVLKRMKRNYNTEKIEDIIQKLKKEIPGIAITTDIIVGFPEETNEEFMETLEFVKRHKLAKAHIFPYSVRKDTLAAEMMQVSDEVKKKRAKKLQEITNICREEFLNEQVGKKASVLWEKMIDEKTIEGLTDNYIRIQRKGNVSMIKTITDQIEVKWMSN